MSSRPRDEDIPPPVAPIYPDRRPEETPAGEPPVQDETATPDRLADTPAEDATEMSADADIEAPDEDASVEQPKDAGEPAEPEEDTTPEAVAAEEVSEAEPVPGEPEAAVRSKDGIESEDDTAVENGQVTVVPGVPRYHRSECILIRFMGEDDLEHMSVESATDAGCTPCRACQPDEPESSAASE